MYAGGGAHGFRNRPEVTGSGPCARPNPRNWCAQPTAQPVRSAPHAHACACASLQVFMLIARNPECAQRNRSAGVGLSGRCALCSAWHAQPRHACLHARAISLVSLRTDRPALCLVWRSGAGPDSGPCAGVRGFRRHFLAALGVQHHTLMLTCRTLQWNLVV